MGMDVAEYRRRLDAKFGTSELFKHAGENSALKFNAPVEHTCKACNKVFKASPLVMLGAFKTDPVCVKCSKKNEHSASDARKESLVKKLRKKFRSKITLVSWSETLSTFRCSCGQSFKARPTEVMRLKAKAAGCRSCTARHNGVDSKSFAVLCKMVKMRTDLKVKRVDKKKEVVYVACVGCGHSWSDDPLDILKSNGCTHCVASKGKKTKVMLGAKAVNVTPQQAEIIEELLKRKCPAKKINTQEKALQHKIGKATISYTPRVVVGKAAYDILAHGELSTDWKSKTVEARVCEKNGKRLSLYVKTEDGVRLLPRNWHKLKIADVEKMLAVGPQEMTILSMDPGTSNHAWSILSITKGFKVNVLGSGMIHNTVKDLKGDMLKKVAVYVEEVAEIAEHYGATHIIMERYMARGMKGSTIECVNVMIGALMGSAAHRLGINADRMMIIPASQWKNEWNRYSDLEAFYGKTKCVNHQVDSVGIGLYGAAVWWLKKPFENIKQLERSLAKMLTDTNMGQVVNRTNRGNRKK